MEGLRAALGLEAAPGGLEENTCSYEIFPAFAEADNAADAQLEALRSQLLQHVLPLLRGYIWQRDRFSLQLSTKRQAPWQQARSGGARRRAAAAAAGDAGGMPPHLWGSVSFGDNIEDEWLVVWVLLELTRAFPVTARVWDNDGEFLLIEAAYGLPRWVKPETAQNRLWLHGGAVHLVPLPRFAGDPLLGATPSLAQALAAVRGSEIDTAAPPKLQAALAPRLSGYPARALEQMHVAHALVPAAVAHLLRAEPQLLAAAVEAFHYRDPDDVKAASRMAAFPPRDMVLAAPTFSRCLYAQLALQEYAPPRGYPMPLPSDSQFKAAEVGLKLTAGFEMVCANRARFGQTDEDGAEGQQGQGRPVAAGADATPGSAATGEASLAGDPGWAAFKAALERRGYFQGSLPGSVQHSQLLAAAVGSYRQSEVYRRSTAALAAPALCIDELLRQPVDPASFPAAEALPPEGSEAWLHEQASSQLEAELAARQAELEAQQARRQARQAQRQQAQQGGDVRGGGEGEFDPGQLAASLRAFVDMVSGLEGAELPSGPGAAPAAPGGGVDLDEAAFASELRRVLGLGKAALRGLGGAGGDADDSASESSDEGSSFYSDGGSSEDESDAEQAAPQRPQRPAAAAAGTAAAAAAATAAATEPAHASAKGMQAPAAGTAPAEQQQQRQEGGASWEAETETDSDDEFMQAYGRAMDAQLAATRMADSFERAPAGAGAPGGAGQQQAQEAQQAAAGGGEDAEAAAEAAALRPVDVDLNLVNSLLASYGEQAGLAGPAGNLAGLLGLRLPDPGQQQQQQHEQPGMQP